MATICCLDRTFTDIAAIVFDKDGTLADVAPYLKRLGQQRARWVDTQVPGVQNSLLLAFGVAETHLNPAGLLAVGSRYENKIAAAAYVAETGRHWSEALEIVEAAFDNADRALQRKADHTPLFAHTLEGLTTLSKAGLQLGLLSADSSDHVQDFLDAYHLQALFQAAKGVDGIVTKPDPSLFYQICALMGVSSEQTLMVGDASVDMKMAKSANAAGGVIVNWGWPTPISSPLADVTLDHWQQLRVEP